MTTAPLESPRPEVWAGIECTVNRVYDQYNDQLECSGHARRVSDLDLFGELGIQAMRYPVVWERTAPGEVGDERGWSWASERLGRLRDLKIRPIVGLIHHGSGPRHTSLVSPGFPEALAAYAGQAARRFPWVEEWTPVNEPLTTARFSGLYGHWYPHGRDEQTFARALIHQCRGIVLSMKAIREINPAAQLIQTDDLGKIYSTPRLQYQADFENERRWLGWDLLCGLVDRHHPMWGHLLWTGIEESELGWFLENPCPPDVIGVNHYLTSERFIDESVDHYPSECIGSNGRDRYADVEAVRVLKEGTPGVRGILSEAWRRYKRPIAVTEAHLGCTREEQMRWLLEVWETACSLRREGKDIRAVTSWALLGSHDWNSLLTRFDGYYEPGAFDVRGSVPRRTGLGHLLRQIAHGETARHAVLHTEGWWRQPQRILYHGGTAPASGTPPFRDVKLRSRTAIARPILITGAKGTLGYAFARLCDHRNLAHVALAREEMDIADPASVEAALKRYNPWAIVNAAGLARVDEAQNDYDRCMRENTAGPALLATVCARQGISLLTFSSDQAFNGRQGRPYVESDPCMPANVYGRSKVKAEESVMEILPAALIARSGPLFSPWEGSNFITRTMEQLADGQLFHAIEDVTVSPTYVPDLVHACLDLLIDGESGIWHLANKGAVTWKQFAQMSAASAGLDESLVQGYSARSLALAAPRPRYTALGTERGQLLQPLDSAILCYLRDSGGAWSRSAAEVEHESRTVPLYPRTRRSRAAQERMVGPKRNTLKRV